MTTLPTEIFATYADSQETGALGSKSKWVIIRENEGKGGILTLHFFDGDTLHDIGIPSTFDSTLYALLSRALNIFEGNLQISGLPGLGSDLAVDVDGLLTRTDNMLWTAPNGNVYRVGVSNVGAFTAVLQDASEGIGIAAIGSTFIIG
jgi:hypothetical protein